MPTSRTFSTFTRIAALILMGLILTACSRGSPATPTEPTPGESTTSPTTTEPTVTPTTAPAPDVIFVAPPEADPVQVEALRLTIGELAEAGNLTWEERPALNAADLGADSQIVVAAPGVDLAAVAGSAGQTRFVMVGSAPASGPANLTTFVLPAEHEAFLAGYTAAIVSEEWRVGMVAWSDAAGYRDAFLNGAYYMCGLCRPKYPPYEDYPAVVEAAGVGDLSAALQTLSGQGVETVFIDPALMGQEAWDALVQTKMNFITAGGVDVPEELASRRLAAVQFDAAEALRVIWPELVAGNGSPSVFAAVTVSDIQPALLSAGRLRLVEETSQALQEGAILPGVVPLQ